MNSIEILKTYINTEIKEKNVKLFTLLNNINYIDTLSRQLFSKNINEINISTLESIIKKIEIDEAQIFYTIKEILEKLSLDSAETINNLTKEDAIEFIVSSFKQLQELSEYRDQLETSIVDNFIDILARMVESLYIRELQKISKSIEYQQLNNEVKELESILNLINKSSNEVLTREEEDKIYNYLLNSNIKDKITILVELGKKWIEQSKTTKIIKEEETTILDSAEELEPEIEIKEIEDLQEHQRVELVKLTNKKTKEEWEKIFKDTITKIQNNNIFTSEERQILEKILLTTLNTSLEELNVYEELVNEFKDITLNSRLTEYLNISDFEINSIGIDLVLNLIPNLENTSLIDVSRIIEKIIEKFKATYLNEEELKEINELIKNTYENYPELTYVTYKEERILYLEEKFIELEGNKEKLLNYDKHHDNMLKTNEECELFIENTMKKIIKTRLEELSNLIESNKEEGLIPRNRIAKIKEEFEVWIGRYSEYNTIKEVQTSYRSYTIEEIERMDFNNKNGIIFLRGEKGSTLYEEGLLTNGLNKNNTIQLNSKKALSKIVKNAVNSGYDLITNYDKFKNPVEKNSASKYVKASKREEPTIIAGQLLYRLSEPGTPARVTVLNLNKIPTENKEKIGISPENTVVLVIGSYEVNFTNESDSYADMRADAERYESKIQEIVSLFKNPNTPKEVLLQYIADSYGLLANLIDEPAPPQPSVSAEFKRGGKK